MSADSGGSCTWLSKEHFFNSADLNAIPRSAARGTPDSEAERNFKQFIIQILFDSDRSER